MASNREKEISDALKRCSPETLDAAIRFQSTHTDQDLYTIINGVFERDLPDSHVGELANADDDTLLVEGLGMDSFGMIEIVMTAETAFGITISNEDLRDIHTLGGLRKYLLANVHQTYFADANAVAGVNASADPL
jgi:3-hydroxyacyl-[acyl-carrier-protein] dehydratase